MPACPTCRVELDNQSVVCPACGTATVDAEVETRPADSAAPIKRPASGGQRRWLSSSGTIDHGWCVFLIVGLRGLLRRMWLVVPATVAFYAMLSVPGVLAGNVHAAIGITTALASVVTPVFVPLRFGLLATAVVFFFSFVLSGSIWSTHLGSWLAGPSLLAFALLTAIVAYGGWAAAGGLQSRRVPAARGASV